MSKAKNGFGVRVASIVIVAGLALSAPALADGKVGAPDPVAAVKSAIPLSGADQALLGVMNTAPARYVAVPGAQEFSGRLIVRPLQAATRAEAIARIAPLVVNTLPPVDHHIVRVPAGVTENQFSAFLMATGQYEYAEPDWIVFPVLVPNDPSYGSQYAHQRVVSEPAWNVTQGSASVTIAITDTGVRTDHVDLAPNIVSGANSATGTAIAQTAGGQVNDLNGHGSHCAGIAAARGNNAIGIAGMGWLNKIMPVRISDSSGGGSSISAIQSGALWAAQNGARIVSTSYSGVSSASNNTVGGTMITAHNSLWFWAAGNANSNLGADNFPNLIIVMATDQNDLKASFSNFGAAIDVGAPGVDILSTWNASTTSYNTIGGTSMACPAAAGIAALILSVNTGLSAATVRDILFTTVDDLGAVGEDDTFGRGRVNSGRAIADAYRRSFPLSVPLFDNFDGSSSFTVSRWVYVDTGVTVSTAALGEPSGANSALVNVTRRLESNAINLAGNSQNLRLSFYTEPRGPAATESLAVEYLNNANAWVSLATVSSPGGTLNSFTRREVLIPNTAAARHAKFAIRFRGTGNAATDGWHIDNVKVGCRADVNNDGEVDFSDIEGFLALYASGNLAEADLNGDGEIDFSDIEVFLALFGSGC